jgi:hypothetical protein
MFPGHDGVRVERLGPCGQVRQCGGGAGVAVGVSDTWTVIVGGQQMSDFHVRRVLCCHR